MTSTDAYQSSGKQLLTKQLQIKMIIRLILEKPVPYLVESHFHFS